MKRIIALFAAAVPALVCLSTISAQDKPAAATPAATPAADTAKPADGAKSADGAKLADGADTTKDESVPAAESAEALLKFAFGDEKTAAETNKAIQEGLETLAAQQDKDKGWFGEENTRIATTSLAGLAFLASGSLPGSGPYGEHINKIVNYLLSTQDANTGYFTGTNDGSRIHGHAYATTFLSQVYGHTTDTDKIKQALIRATSLLVTGQTKDGGWGYVPDDATWDEGSTTVCCLQALRCAQTAGITVKNTAIANAVGYIEKIATPRAFRAEDGPNKGQVLQGYTFKYSLGSGSSSDSWALVAASCACINNFGVYSKYARWNEKNIGAILDGGMHWLHYRQGDFLDRTRGGRGGLDVSHFLYANFYACQACWQYSDTTYFKDYFPKVRDFLLAERNGPGGKGWHDHQYGVAYGSAFALLILQVPYQYLPAFQR